MQLKDALRVYKIETEILDMIVDVDIEVLLKNHHRLTRSDFSSEQWASLMKKCSDVVQKLKSNDKVFKSIILGEITSFLSVTPDQKTTKNRIKKYL